jgi:RNA polymerase sigma-70 factor (ECF subfamily)
MGRDPSDEELMLLYQHDNQAAGSMLFERYQGPLLGYLQRMLGTRWEAEEALQEAFLKVHERREQYTGRGSFGGWIYRIATHGCLDRMRRKNRRPEGHVIPLNGDGVEEDSDHGVVVPDRHENPREAACGLELGEKIEAAIERLPPSLRTVFLLRQKAGLGYEEIESILGEPGGRLRVRFHRARKALYQELRADLAPEEEG